MASADRTSAEPASLSVDLRRVKQMRPTDQAQVQLLRSAAVACPMAPPRCYVRHFLDHQPLPVIGAAMKR